MATWDFDTPSQNTNIQDVQRYLTENLQSTTAGLNGARMLDLYNFLHSHTFANPRQLKSAVSKDGAPLFTDEEAAQVFSQLTMRGGGESVEFFDSMAKRLAGYTGDLVPDGAKGYLYFLKALEQNPDQGPLVSTMLDIVGQGLPTIAATIQTVAPQLIGALPIPSAAIAGVIIGWIMSAFFLFLAILTNLSRKKFGSAFVTAAALVPVVGASIMNAAKTLERVSGKMSDRREKLVKSVNSVFGPEIGASVVGFIPDLNDTSVDVPVPTVSAPSLGAIGALAKGKLGAMPSLGAMGALAKGKLGAVPSLGAMGALANGKLGALAKGTPSLAALGSLAKGAPSLGISNLARGANGLSANMLTRKPT